MDQVGGFYVAGNAPVTAGGASYETVPGVPTSAAGEVRFSPTASSDLTAMSNEDDELRSGADRGRLKGELVTCDECGGAMASTRENWEYDESGLPNVILESIEVRRCRSCGTREPVIPRIEELHRILLHPVAPPHDAVPRRANRRVRFDDAGWTELATG